MAQVRKASGRDRTTETTRELPQAISRSSSAGSIRKSITKVPSEGLIVLPPDKEFVRFENGGDSSTNCVSVVRVGSAGRVERNLQMARKKELEDEISTDSASASGITVYGELQKGETKCKPLKQTDKLDVKVDRKEEEESESSDSDSSDSDEPETSASAAATEAKEGAAQAPVELKGKFCCWSQIIKHAVNFMLLLWRKLNKKTRRVMIVRKVQKRVVMRQKRMKTKRAAKMIRMMMIMRKKMMKTMKAAPMMTLLYHQALST